MKTCEQLTVFVNLRVTPEQSDVIQRAADRFKMSRSDYIRAVMVPRAKRDVRREAATRE